MNAPTDWTSAIAILVAGLALGLLFVYLFSKRKTAPPVSDDLVRKDLEARRDVLIQQLRDLDPSASDERERLESETADVLRRLDLQPTASVALSSAPAAEAPAAGALTMNPTAKGFLWGAGSIGALALLAYFVMNVATPRQEGGSLTGNLPGEEQQGAPQQPDAALLQLQAAVQRDPNNLSLRNDLAQAYLERDNMMAVFEETQRVLQQAPEDSRALTLQGLVRLAMGEAAAAETMLKQATRSDPSNLDSWVSLAWLYMQQNKTAEAEAMIAEAAKQSPAEKAKLEEVFGQMKAQIAMAGQPQQPAVAGGELPPGHPPVDGGPVPAGPLAAGAVAPAAAPAMAPAAMAPAAAGGAAVTVTLELDPSARGKTGVLYVMARNPLGGPPVAVKRLMVTSWPTTFILSQADSMMGQPLPNTFRLEARLDSDGDAATKLPTDPAAMQAEVSLGTSVRMLLK